MWSRLEGTEVAVAASIPELNRCRARRAKATGCFFAVRLAANRGREKAIVSFIGKI
ncbi:hypothetical protein [Roseateles oligotrophus]|uniref:Uncharacterized protein n=1 Tax=Roseateles oligotrophus TaxID=1769250 RepID=A0ABT2YMV7_9BURK|nr:hypothetical protein [Roseateles oligotrophus]MCV2371409.1 hypothetical protein [Roseateles oligotrophus]